MARLSLLAKDPFGCVQADLLHPGDESIEAAGIGSPLFHEWKLVAADSDTDRLAGDLSGPLDVGTVWLRRSGHAAAPLGVAASIDRHEISSQEEVGLSEGLFQNLEASAFAAEPDGISGSVERVHLFSLAQCTYVYYTCTGKHTASLDHMPGNAPTTDARRWKG